MSHLCRCREVENTLLEEAGECEVSGCNNSQLENCHICESCEKHWPCDPSHDWEKFIAGEWLENSKMPECGDFEVMAVTKDALLLSDGCGIQVWIPKSEICEDSDLVSDSEKGDEGVLMIPEWLAVKKGLV